VFQATVVRTRSSRLPATPLFAARELPSGVPACLAFGTEEERLCGATAARVLPEPS
jgi:hypothetical protein